MFQRLGGRPDGLAQMDRIEALVRDRFALAPDEIVLVAEEPGLQPGQPDRTCVIRFWKGGARHRIRLFKPLADVDAADLPPSWLRAAFLDDGDPDCC